MPTEAKDYDEIPEDEMTSDGEIITEDEGDEYEEAAFAAAFAGDDGEEEPPQAEMSEPDDGEEAEPEPEIPMAASAPSDDGLAGRVRSLEGKIGTLSDQLTRALSDNASARAPDAPAPTHAEIKDAMGSSEKIQALAEEYPEWGEAMTEQAELVTSNILSRVPSQQQISEAIAVGTDAARQLAYLDFKHEGWEDTVQTQEFRNWVAAQDQETQALADSNSAKDAATMLDKYEEFRQNAGQGGQRNTRTEQKDRRLRQATTPTKGTSRHQDAPDEDSAFESGFYGR